MWLSHTGQTPGELPKGCLGWEILCLLEREGNWSLLCLRDAVIERQGYQHQELHHDLFKVQPHLPRVSVGMERQKCGSWSRHPTLFLETFRDENLWCNRKQLIGA